MSKIYPGKQAIITGVISGIFAAGAFSVLTSLNDNGHWGINPATLRWLTGLFTLLILAIGVYSGMQAIKRGNSGRLTYGQAIATGVLTGLTVGVCVAVIGLIYTRLINPGYVNYMLAENKKDQIAAGKSAAEIAGSQAAMAKMLTPGIQIMQALVLQTAAATIISLIIGLFLKSKKS